MSDIAKKAKDFLLQEIEDLKTTGAYLKTMEAKEAFARKANYKISFLKQLTNEVIKADSIIAETEQMGGNEPPIIAEDKIKSDTAVIREMLFYKGKEAARAESIALAMKKWNNLY